MYKLSPDLKKGLKMEISKEITEMLIIMGGLIVISLFIIKFLSKSKKPRKLVTLNLSNIPEPKKVNLTSKQKLMNRLIDYEIKRLPHLSRSEAHKLALERLARDNR